MSIYSTIFRRRSVRNYTNEEIDADTLQSIEDYANSINQLDNCKVRFGLIPKDKVSGAKGQYCIAAYSDKKREEYINIGYTMQHLDLYLQSIGLGSLWLGLGVSKEKDNKFAIVMCFGKTEEPMRESEKDFKRLDVLQISNEDNSIARVARLAPSATNSQPWKLEFFEGGVRVHYFGRGVLQRILRAKLSMIDLGIISRYIELAIKSENKKLTAIKPYIEKDRYFIDIFYK